MQTSNDMCGKEVTKSGYCLSYEILQTTISTSVMSNSVNAALHTHLNSLRKKQQNLLISKKVANFEMPYLSYFSLYLWLTYVVDRFKRKEKELKCKIKKSLITSDK